MAVLSIAGSITVPSVVSAAQSVTSSTHSEISSSEDWNNADSWSPDQIATFFNAASTQALQPRNSMILPQSQLSEDQINTLANELNITYPEFSRQYLLDIINKQLIGDYTITPDPYSMSLREGWKGITVNQMGATIDAALGIALAAGTGGLSVAIGTVGKHAAKSALRTIAVKFLGSKALSFGLDVALNLASPGTYLAKQWDKHDAYPSNGRINF